MKIEVSVFVRKSCISSLYIFDAMPPALSFSHLISSQLSVVIIVPTQTMHPWRWKHGFHNHGGLVQIIFLSIMDGCRFHIHLPGCTLLKVNPSNIPYVCIMWSPQNGRHLNDPWFLIIEKCALKLGCPHIKQPQWRTVGFLQKSVEHVGCTG